MSGKLSARQKLELSRLHLSQQELMGQDVDVEKMHLIFQNHFDLDIAEAITDANIERTVEGASTLTVKVFDRDRALLNAGKLAARTDIKIDGLWFRLAAVGKDSDELTLTFEDREIAVLRTYKKIIKATAATSRGKVTRAEFILRMIREVKEFKIPWVIPELEFAQPIEEDQNTQKTYGSNDWNQRMRGKGIPHGAGHHRIESDRGVLITTGLTVQGDPMTNEQIDVANTILDTGSSMQGTRAQLVMSMMCVIQESRVRNLKGGDRDSVGAFQQRKSQGWPASRNVARDAKAFFTALKNIDSEHPGWNYGQKVQGVQHSAYPDRYAKWRAEAERIVEAYGNSSDFAGSNNMGLGSFGQNDYEFYRGVPPAVGLQKWGKEDSWTCIQRLAQEVNWRAFFVSGTFYYLSEQDLMESKPAAILRETTKGVEDISGDYDPGKKNAELRVSARMGRWAAPPGSVILIRDMGPWNGRWLINDIQRSLFDSLGTITLKKPLPVLPEPIGDTAGSSQQQSFHFNSGAPPPAHAAGEEFIHAADAAKKLLEWHRKGKYRDDNGHQIAQLKKVAAGQKLRNQCGALVEMSPTPLNAILALIDKGFWVGTFALCEDHDCNDGQHPKGQAVDISSLGSQTEGWNALNQAGAFGTRLAKEAMRNLKPYAWDLICNGVGRLDPTVQALQMDNGHSRKGNWWPDHTTHIHLGTYPGKNGAG